jgi:hypothetical protein
MPPIIPVIIIDPANYHWVQDIDTQLPIKQFLPGLVKRLGLPEKLKYVLVHPANRQPLPDAHTLAQAAIRPRDSLWIHPVRDSLLSDLLEDLYDKAADAIKDAAWDKAQELLEQQFRLDPRHPDSRGLHRALNAQGRFVGRGPQRQGQQWSSGGQQHDRPGPQSQSAPARPAQDVGPGIQGQGLSAQPGTPGAQAPLAQPIQPPRPAAPRSGSSAGCAIAGILGGLAAVGGVAVMVVTLIAVVGYLRNTAEPNLGTGDVQITLRWDGPADLDLHVIDPFGEEIWYSHAASASGGQLDVDAHAGCSTNVPVENVFWPTGGAPSGAYEVAVHNFAACGAGAVTYTVTVTLDGVVLDQWSGTLSGQGDSELVAEFNYP